MQYKTICLQRIQKMPELYTRLLNSRSLLSEVERYATQPRTSHLDWMDQLATARPGSSESQIASEAMELALKDLEEALPSESAPDDSSPLSLDAAMAFISRHTPAA